MLYKLKENITTEQLETIGFTYSESDIWCGTDNKIPHYRKDGLFNNGYYGTYIIDLSPSSQTYKILRCEAEYWYGWLDGIYKKEIQDIVASGLFELVQ